MTMDNINKLKSIMQAKKELKQKTKLIKQL